MAVTLAATFTLISCAQGSICIASYKNKYLESCSVVGETLNCECEVKIPLDLYAVGLMKYGTTVGHVATMCHLMHLHISF